MVLVLSNHLSLSTQIMLLMLHRCKTCYIKSNIITHIALKCLSHELLKSRGINILQFKSCDVLADQFTKSLPTITFMFMGLVYDDFVICKVRGRIFLNDNLFKASYYTLFPFMSLPFRFSLRFLMR